MSEVLDLLGRGDLRVLGRIIGSSNSALLVEVSLDGQTALAIHKPIAFERPLWDYPDGDLAHREHAEGATQQRMPRDGLGEAGREVELALHELEALELDLAAAEVE